jgi:Tetratricopeptide repeat.
VKYGESLLRLGRREEARIAFEKALKLDPEHRGALAGLRQTGK